MPSVKCPFIQKVVGGSLLCQSFHCRPVQWKPILTECQRLSRRGGRPKMRTEYIKEFPGKEICVQNITLIFTTPKMQTGLSGIKRNIWERKTPLNMFSSQFHISLPFSNMAKKALMGNRFKSGKYVSKLSISDIYCHCQCFNPKTKLHLFSDTGV